MTGERVLVIDTDRFLDADFSKLEARLLHAGLRFETSVSGQGGHVWIVGTPTGRPSAYAGLWAQKTPAEVFADAKAGFALMFGEDRAAEQDRLLAEFARSRPFDALTALGEGPKAGKVPPVIAHAPPARRGRWSRG